MFLCIVHGVLLWYGLVFPHFSLIHYSLASSHLFLISLCDVLNISLLFSAGVFFPQVPNYLQLSIFAFLLTLLCPTATSVMAALDFFILPCLFLLLIWIFLMGMMFRHDQGMKMTDLNSFVLYCITGPKASNIVKLTMSPLLAFFVRLAMSIL